jgi:UDP-N-acetylglucosamine 2-epimerase (non-hydrolysing)
VKVISVVGARPQFVKLAPVDRALKAGGHDHFVIHTGQHYDEQMSGAFFTHLGLRSPEVNLAVGSATHGAQTALMLQGIESVLMNEPSDWVLTYGDTNSTVAAALAASKLRRRTAHLEAGLRSFNRAMPEELNRVATDHLSDLLLAPTVQAVAHLTREGLVDRTRLTGDVMTDVCLQTRSVVTGPGSPSSIVDDWPDGFVLATIHRPSNTDDAERLKRILSALGSLSAPVVLAAHPRLIAAARMHGQTLRRPGLEIVPPLDYPSIIKALSRAAAVVTDSGGLQKEAYVLGVPCTTVRSETEWTETLGEGWNVLAPEPEHLADVALREAQSVPPEG